MHPGSVAVIPGATQQRRSNDIFFPFRQDSDFYYLTGFCEPDALLVLIPGRAQGESILFCRERDPYLERRDGAILGPDQCQTVLGVDDAFPISDVDEILPGLLEARSQIYMNLGEHLTWDERVLAWLDELGSGRPAMAATVQQVTALGHLLHEQRLIKERKEQVLMARAAQISVAAQYAALARLRPNVSEADLEAELLYSYRKQGARFEAYPSIVAAGDNACVLHYTRNESLIADGDLVLIDAGCEFAYYAADVTRTYPASGRYGQTQRALYDLVLKANCGAIAACRPGADFNHPHCVATQILVDGLIALGLLRGTAEALIASGAYAKFCPHKTSHWLGLDVHDVGDYRLGEQWRDLMPGMVLTIEPGIYIPRDSTTEDVPDAFRGIGIRVEDSVLITPQGCQVLTRDLIKDPDEIERWMATNGSVGQSAQALKKVVA
ncbi:MAG: aminopeptidase P N-terminal domain-containing protein [Pseudomonadales bacterium]|nr:aminopeptidase P N-terminal domain-containing protein [Pseudomonadales bacterium]